MKSPVNFDNNNNNNNNGNNSNSNINNNNNKVLYTCKTNFQLNVQEERERAIKRRRIGYQRREEPYALRAPCLRNA